MFWTWILGLAGAVFGLICFVLIYDRIFGVRKLTMAFALCVIVSAAIGTGIGLHHGMQPDKEYDSYTIYSVDDTMSSSGRFILGSGYIQQNPIYVFYSDVENGGYRRDYLYASKTIIYEDAPDNIGYVKSIITPCDYLFELHVPKGTIKQELVLDNR